MSKTNKSNKIENKTTPRIIIDNDDICHHMPDNAYYPELTDGMTLRAALAELRRADWGNMGRTHDIELTDGTWIAVELQSADGNCSLMSSQYVRRYSNWQGRAYTVRCYKL